MNFDTRIRKAKNIADMFDIVQDMVKQFLGYEQAGILVGLSDLGMYNQGWIGAFYSLPANMIIINNKPLKHIQVNQQKLYNYYLFHVLLHEYVHAIGSYDEEQTRVLVAEMSRHFFGETHVVTELASHIEKFLPQLTYAGPDFSPPEDLSIDFQMGIDRRNTNYIN
jgi:hypothetical protein